MAKADPETKQRIVDAINESNVGFTDDVGLASQPDGPILFREISAWGAWKDGKLGNQGGFKLSWSKPGLGFGELMFYLKGGKLHCKTEGLSRTFVREALIAISDIVELHE